MKAYELYTKLRDLMDIDCNVAQYEVITEGCDCDGKSNEAIIKPFPLWDGEDFYQKNVVYITRGD